ncbi:glycosyltransferase family 4 protein [Vibrio sp. CyArs1]|uniref:glycosyltransferase family 4 protein n=1 Tax=Vibrio sp. CyArs1 TaxID=2682577 RepID=UPI001F06C2A9|nr:glycosyltransferase family 4 protein [Vibrio sp. CyArs1]
MSILIIHQSADLYGSDKTLLEFVKYIKTREDGVYVVLPCDGPLKKKLDEINADVIILPIIKLHRGIFKPKDFLILIKNLIALPFRYSKIIKDKKIQYIYSNTLAVMDGVILKIINRKLKHSWHVHEILNDLGIFNKIYGFLLRNFTDNVIVNSSATSNYIENISNIKSDIVLNGVDVNIYKPQLKKEKLDKVVIGLVGRINDWKGHLLLLKAMNETVCKEYNIKFVGSFVEGSKFKSQFLDAVNNHKYKDRIFIQEFSDSPHDVWGDIDICVVPSIKPEPFGLVVIEAMAIGIPVIASDAGGPKEIISDGITGSLFEIGNSKALAKKIDSLVISQELREIYEGNGIIRVNELFTISKYNELLYQKII